MSIFSAQRNNSNKRREITLSLDREDMRREREVGFGEGMSEWKERGKERKSREVLEDRTG